MSLRSQMYFVATIIALVASSGVSAGRTAPSMAPTIAINDEASASEQDMELNLLFLQQSDSGKISMINSREGSLELKGVSEYTTWFADRPGRSAGQVETSFFVGSNFTDAQGDWLAKPNAALYISKPGQLASTDLVIILTLTQPSYNDTDGTLTYKVEIVPATSSLQEGGPMPREGSLVKSFLQLKDDPTTPTLLNDVEGGELLFDSAVLFIDDWSGNDRSSHSGGDDRSSHSGGDERSSHRGGDDRSSHRGGDDRDSHRGGDDRGSHRGGDDRGSHRGGDDRSSNWGRRWCGWGWGWCGGSEYSRSHMAPSAASLKKLMAPWLT
eukprot:jgi/Botrbrau1/7664/Bobra.0159s0106.1